VGRGDPESEATYILDKIAAALASFEAGLEDVVRTRVYLADADDWEAVSRAHARAFAATRPANTLVGARLVGPYRVEIEAEAIAPASRAGAGAA
jgi:enamine deaminase RidA (YjgF/YER057c/UK114 family)